MHLRPNAACTMTATTRTILAVDLGKNKSVACVNDPAAGFAFIEQHPIPNGGGSGHCAFGSWHNLSRSHRPAVRLSHGAREEEAHKIWRETRPTRPRAAS